MRLAPPRPQGIVNKKGLLAMTYSPRESPPKYHQR
jgi:hypothetical protein